MSEKLRTWNGNWFCFPYDANQFTSSISVICALRPIIRSCPKSKQKKKHCKCFVYVRKKSGRLITMCIYSVDNWCLLFSLAYCPIFARFGMWKCIAKRNPLIISSCSPICPFLPAAKNFFACTLWPNVTTSMGIVCIPMTVRSCDASL